MSPNMQVHLKPSYPIVESCRSTSKAASQVRQQQPHPPPPPQDILSAIQYVTYSKLFVFWKIRSSPLWFLCVAMCSQTTASWVISECFHGCLQFYTAVTHTLTGGSDPEPNLSKGIQCLPDRRCRGAAEAQEQDQMVNRWREGWRGTQGFKILFKMSHFKKESWINTHLNRLPHIILLLSYWSWWLGPMRIIILLNL